MRRPERRGLDPQDLAFAAFLVLMAGRLAAVEGPGGPHARLFLGLLALQAGVLLLASPRVRLLFYPFALQAGYFLLGPAMHALQVVKADALLQHVDRRLLGADLSLLLEPAAHPLLTELMSACYLLFFPYLIVTHLHFFRGDADTLRRFCAGLYTVYAVGLIGYVLLPAAGPYVAMAADFHEPLEGGWLTRIHQAIVVGGTNGVDVFPSLHCAVTCFLLFFDRRHAPGRYRLLLLPVAILWVSTIYLRYHYFVDVVAGFSLAAFGLLLAARPGPHPVGPKLRTAQSAGPSSDDVGDERFKKGGGESREKGWGTLQ